MLLGLEEGIEVIGVEEVTFEGSGLSGKEVPSVDLRSSGRGGRGTAEKKEH